MRLVVVFAVIAELQHFWVFADPKASYKEPPKANESQGIYKAQSDQAWIAEETRKLQRGFLPSSSSRDYPSRYQPRTSPVPEERYRPQEYPQYQPSSDYMPRRDGTRHTCFQRRPENQCPRCSQLMSKYAPKDYRQISPKSYSRPETKYNSLQTPYVNSEGYQVVNEDPSLHMAVISQSDQYSQPQVLTIRDNGQGYTSQVSQYPSQGPPMSYEYPEASRGMQSVQSGSEGYVPYDQQPEMQYKPRHSHQKSMPYVNSNSDTTHSHRIEVLSNRQILDFVNQ